MAVSLISGSSEAAVWSAPPIGGASALSVLSIIKLSAATVTGDRILTTWDNASADNDAFMINVQDTDEVGFIVRNFPVGAGQFGLKTTSLNLSSGTEYRILGTWSGAGTITIWVNGSSQSLAAWIGSNFSNIASNPGPLTAGYHSTDSLACADGDYSESAIWTRVLSDSEAAAVTTFASPAMFRRGLVFYDKMINKNSVNEYGTVPTYSGGSNAAHPRIIYPSAQILQFPPTAAGGGGPSVNINGSTVSWNGLTSYNWNGIA